MSEEVKEAENNYYMIRACALGAKRTGVTTFMNQICYGNVKGTQKDEIVMYKDFYRIGGKLRVNLQLSEKPSDISGISNGYFEKQAILLLCFDLSRPETFHHEGMVSGYDNVHIEWLRKEASDKIKNPKITVYLVGTNSDKATTFDKDEARRYASE
jgi:hypothetical protein